MSRWIDADALKRQVESPYTEYPIMIQIRRAIKEFINSAPSIDIVRCQDCRHRYMDADLQVWTCTYGLMIKPNGFCNYGERREP